MAKACCESLSRLKADTVYPCSSTRGVLETLHILDMSQGLMGSDAAALLPIHEGKRKNCLPTIVEWAPAVKNKPVDVSADCSPHKVQGMYPCVHFLSSCLLQYLSSAMISGPACKC